VLDLSHKAELNRLTEVMADLRAAVPEVGPLLVGAMARDVLLQHAHGIRPRRATEDIDLAIAVADWGAFATLRQALLDSSCFERAGKAAHKLRHRSGLPLDLIPFGGVQRPDGTIAWPPNGDEVMAVLGYRTALATALTVLLPQQVRIAVVALPMLAVLKVLAWFDRHWQAPRKDAADLIAVLRNYLEAGQKERLYDEAAHLLEADDFDLDRASAWLVGHDVLAILNTHREEAARLLALLVEILNRECDPEGPLHLIGQVDEIAAEPTRQLLLAFLNGLQGQGGP